jgi:hypothetical protein
MGRRRRCSCGWRRREIGWEKGGWGTGGGGGGGGGHFSIRVEVGDGSTGAPRNRRGLRERERERGGPTLTQAGGAPVSSGPKLVGASDVARPCHAAGLNRGGGGRLTGGASAQWRAAAVESVEKGNYNSIEFK